MTPQELDRWQADYMRKLNHKITLDKIRRDGDAWIRDFRKKWSDIHRLEEQNSFRLLKLRVQCASQDAKLGKKPFPLALAQKWTLIHAEACGVTP